MFTALLLIGLGLVALFWLAGKARQGMAGHNAFFTQLRFIQMYMADNTEKQFYGKTEAEAIELGQDMLWAAAEDFHGRMDKAVNHQLPVQAGDMGLILASIRIIKAAEAMVFIKKNGPIVTAESDEQTREVDSSGA